MQNAFEFKVLSHIITLSAAASPPKKASPPNPPSNSKSFWGLGLGPFIGIVAGGAVLILAAIMLCCCCRRRRRHRAAEAGVFTSLHLNLIAFGIREMALIP